jgi:hypothetical protein
LRGLPESVLFSWRFYDDSNREPVPYLRNFSVPEVFIKHRATPGIQPVKFSKEDNSVKHKVYSLLATLALVAALAAPVSVPAAPAPKPQPAPAPATAPEPHPEIREALASLRRARMHMQEAAHDFGGHRVEALKATDEAIRQLEICLKFDR